jgi:hypothetical protein
MTQELHQLRFNIGIDEEIEEDFTDISIGCIDFLVFSTSVDS